MATDHSHSSLPAADDVGVNSPNSRRPAAWASVVRGNSELISSTTATAVTAAPPGQALGESSGREARPECPDADSEGNAGGPRRPAWKIPSNGVVDGGSVMGEDVSWPALSESTRPGLRSSFDSVRPSYDLPASTSQATIISTPTCRQTNANSAANSTTPTRPRSRNRGGGGGGGGSPSAGGASQNNFGRPSNPPPPPPPPPFPIFGLPLPYELIPPILNSPVSPVRGTRPVGGGEGSQSHLGNDHSSPRHTSRRLGNHGSRPRGDAPYHGNYGGWRDQDRRDVLISPQYGPPPPLGYMPPTIPPGAPPFMVPPPVRLIPGQMGFDMASPFIYVPTVHPETFGVIPMVPPSQPPLPRPASNMNPLSNLIVSQIDYYFSDVNLMTDNFLKSNMDDHGWVPITLIASFPRVHLLTQDIPLILESLRGSTLVEVQGEKVRRLHEWGKWLNSSAATPVNALATSFQETSLDDDSTTRENGNTDARVEMASGRILAETLSGSSRLANGDDSVEEVHSISV